MSTCGSCRNGGRRGPTGPTGTFDGTVPPPLLGILYNNGGDIGTSTDGAIASDGSAIVSGVSNGGPVPSEGNLRLMTGGNGGAGWQARFVDDTILPHQQVLAFFAFTELGKNWVGMGGLTVPLRTPHFLNFVFREAAFFGFSTLTPEGNQEGAAFGLLVNALTPPIPGFTERRFWKLSRHTNFVIAGQNNTAPFTAEDFLGHGEGVIFEGFAEVVPTTAPVALGVIRYVSPLDGEEYYLKNGAPLVRRPMFVASYEAELAADAQITTSAFGLLLQVLPVVPDSGVLDIIATASGHVTGAAFGEFQITVDAVVVANGGASLGTGAASSGGTMSIVKRVSGLTPGAVAIVQLEWAVSNNVGPLDIQPVTLPRREHASLLARPSS